MAAARLAEAWDAALRTFTGAKSQAGRFGESRRNERPYSEHAMTQAGSKAMNEPSMEDILASIRRIIAEDYSAQQAMNGAPQAAPVEAVQRPQPVAPHPAQNQFNPPQMPTAPSDILDLNSRAERFRPPMPEVVPVPPPSSPPSQAYAPRAAAPTLRMTEPAPAAAVAQSAEPQGFAARAVSEFSERLGRSFAAAERYQREAVPQRAVQAAAPEPVTSATVEAVAAAVQSHLAAAQAVRMAEPQPAPEIQREAQPVARAETMGVRAAAESRLAAAREQAQPQPAPVPQPAAQAQVSPAPQTVAQAPASRPAEPLMQNDPPPAWLVSPRTTTSVSGSFKALSDNKTSPQPTLTDVQSAALQELVAAALRPMLKDWLDQHLPGMVERMITAEIQRVTRGQ